MQICSGLAQLAKAGMFLVFGILVFGCSADQCCSGQCNSYLGILVHIWVFGLYLGAFRCNADLRMTR